MLPDACRRGTKPRTLAFAGGLVAVVATSAFASGRGADQPHGLLVGAFNGRIVGYELPTAKRVVLRGDDDRGYPLYASLSPDGARLAFSYRPPTENETYEVRVRDRHGSRDRTLMTQFWTDVIRWSPDSALLLVGGSKDQYIFDLDANLFWAWRPCGGVRDPVVLKWADDGRGLFVWQIQGNDPADKGQAVWRCDLDGHRQKVLVAPSTSTIGRMAMAPDEKRVLVIDSRHLLLKEIDEVWPRAVLSLPVSLDNLIVFWSPDGKWAGAAGQLRETKIPLVPDLILKNLETGAQQVIKVPGALAVQWWAPSPAPTMDTRAIVRAGLGPGKPFTPPLAVP